MSGHSIYLDDAGHPEDKPYLVLGGFISSEERWIAFEEPWRDILRFRKLDFPFHSTDFFSKYKKDPKLKHIVADLVRTITNYVEAAFSVVIDLNAYKEFNQKLRVEEFIGTPYAILTRRIHENVELWQQVVGVGPRHPLLYFVESGTLHRGDMMDCLQDRDKINPPVPVPKSHIACQAADLYAYSVYRSAMEGRAFLSYQDFEQKLQFPKERLDSKIFRPELESYLSKPNTTLVGVPGKIRIPPRSGTENIKVNFEGNTKKFRRATVGLPKK